MAGRWSPNERQVEFPVLEDALQSLMVTVVAFPKGPYWIRRNSKRLCWTERTDLNLTLRKLKKKKWTVIWIYGAGSFPALVTPIQRWGFFLSAYSYQKYDRYCLASLNSGIKYLLLEVAAQTQTDFRQMQAWHHLNAHCYLPLQQGGHVSPNGKLMERISVLKTEAGIWHTAT